MRKNDLGSQFRSASRGALIPFARDTRDKRPVSLPGDVLQPGGDWYREDDHKGHLCCPECDAGVYFFPEVKAKNGTDKLKAAAHFKTVPGGLHDKECAVGQKIDRRDEPAAPKTVRGYRLNINSLTGSVAEDSRLRRGFNSVRRAPGQKHQEEKRHKLPLHDMSYLEPYSVKGVGDIAEFLAKTDKEMIDRSVVVFEQFEIRLKDFLLYYNHASREDKRNIKFKNFVSRMIESGRRSQPVVMEIETSKMYTADELKAGKAIRSTNIVVPETPKTGPRHLIMPSAFADTRNTNVTWGFHDRDTYLVMGIVKLTEGRNGNIYLNISITSPDQVMKGSILSLWEKNKMRQASPSGQASDIKPQI